MLWGAVPAPLGLPPSPTWPPPHRPPLEELLEKERQLVPECLICQIAPTASTLLFLYAIHPVR